MNKKEVKFLILSFVSWRVILYIFLFLSVFFIKLEKDFIGGRLENYLKAPYLWAWANFDGEHYLSIAYRGYQPLKYFFFPVYPIIIRFFTGLFNQRFISYAISGFLVSNISFLIALYGFWKLVKLDFKINIVKYSIALLLLFPTSFYFGSVYSESLFLALTVWLFYFARKGKWIWAGLLGAISTATRIVGIALIPALFAEYIIQNNEGRPLKTRSLKVVPIISVLLVPLGLIIYMIYLNKVAGDPLEFFHSVGIYGEQRSAGFVMLPQVFYRYVFKILPKIDYQYFPVVFTAWLEFITAIIFGILAGLGILGGLGKMRGFKFRLSYATYLAFGYLIPTLSGSFSSLPRYVLVLFPAFILCAIYLSKLKKTNRLLLFIALFLLLAIATSLFVRGYWVA